MIGPHVGATSHVGVAFGAGGGIPSVALQLVGDSWVVDDANADPPDGYMVASGDGFAIDDAATSGLTLGVSAGQPYVEN